MANLFSRCMYLVHTLRLITLFVFNDPATTAIYTYLHALSLHDALPIYHRFAACSPSTGTRHRAWRDHRRYVRPGPLLRQARSEEHTSELQSLMRISYAVFCLKKKKLIKVLNIESEPHININFVPKLTSSKLFAQRPQRKHTLQSS